MTRRRLSSLYSYERSVHVDVTGLVAYGRLSSAAFLLPGSGSPSPSFTDKGWLAGWQTDPFMHLLMGLVPPSSFHFPS